MGLSSSELRFVNLSDDLSDLLEGTDAHPYPERAGLDLPVEDPTELYNSVAVVPRLADEVWLAEILGERELLYPTFLGSLASPHPVDSPVVSQGALSLAEAFSESYFSSLTDKSGPSRLFLRKVPSFCRSGDWVKYGACVELDCECSGISRGSPPTSPSACGYGYCDDVGQDPDVQTKLAESPELSALAGNPFYCLFSDDALTDLMVPCVTRGLRVVRPADGGLPLSAETLVRPVSPPGAVPVGARYAAAYSDIEPIRAIALSEFSLSGASTVAGTDGRSGSSVAWSRCVRTKYDDFSGSVMAGYPDVSEFTLTGSFEPGPSRVGLAGFSPVSGRTAWNVNGYFTSGPAPFRGSSESTSRYDSVPLASSLVPHSNTAELHTTSSENENFRFVPEEGTARFVCRTTIGHLLDGDQLIAFGDVIDGVWLGVQAFVTSRSGHGTTTWAPSEDYVSSGSATAVAGSYIRFVKGDFSLDGTVEFRIPVAGGDLPESPPPPDFSVSWTGSGSGSGSGSVYETKKVSSSVCTARIVGTGPLVIGMSPRVTL